MSVKRGCLLSVLGGIALLCGIVALVFWLSGGAVESAETSLSQLAAGQTEAVYQANSSPPIPSDLAVRRLVRSTLTGLAEALQAGGDFQAFHSSISERWQSQSSPESLRSVFSSLLGADVDFGAAGGEPVFSETPWVDDDGILHLNGYATAAGSPNLNYELKYTYEHPSWKLFGIRVSLADQQ